MAAGCSIRLEVLGTAIGCSIHGVAGCSIDGVLSEMSVTFKSQYWSVISGYRFSKLFVFFVIG